MNWAHICMALLIQAGYVDRVLVANFDSLLVRACAMLGEFPAVYDLAASETFKPADIPDKALFYLHGQRTGFILVNTPQEFATYSGERLQRVFEHAGQNRTWIVAGYSGVNDPIFEHHIARMPSFEHGLYWVCRGTPDEHVREKLLLAGKDAYYAEGYDADSFFVRLTQELDLFPPSFVDKPFSYTESIMEMLTPFTPPRQTSRARPKSPFLLPVRASRDVMSTPRRWLHEAKLRHEVRAPLIADAQRKLMIADYAGVVALRSAYKGSASPDADLAAVLYSAYVMQGNELLAQAMESKGDDTEQLLTQIEGKYREALEINPDGTEALDSWGTLLAMQAMDSPTDEADGFFEEAEEKYRAAAARDTSNDQALFNWATMLWSWAERKQKSGQEAQSLLNRSVEKYEAAANVEQGQGTKLVGSSRVKAASDLACYNLACLYATLGEEARCKRWLEECESRGSLLAPDTMEKDLDLQSVAVTAWFKDLISRARALTDRMGRGVH